MLLRAHCLIRNHPIFGLNGSTCFAFSIQAGIMILRTRAIVTLPDILFHLLDNQGKTGASVKIKHQMDIKKGYYLSYEKMLLLLSLSLLLYVVPYLYLSHIHSFYLFSLSLSVCTWFYEIEYVDEMVC